MGKMIKIVVILEIRPRICDYKVNKNKTDSWFN